MHALASSGRDLHITVRATEGTSAPDSISASKTKLMVLCNEICTLQSQIFSIIVSRIWNRVAARLRGDRAFSSASWLCGDVGRYSRQRATTTYIAITASSRCEAV